MTRICVLVLIGLPGAGKTHLSYWLLQKQHEINCNIIHLCYDDFLPNTYENVDNHLYKQKRIEILQLLEKSIHSLKQHQSLSSDLQAQFHVNKTAIVENIHDYIIICDDNNYYRSMRYKVYQLCSDNDLYFAQIYVKTDIQDALQAVEKRSVKEQCVPAHVVNKMYSILEKPKASWELNSLILQNTIEWPQDVLFKFLLNSFNHKAQIHNEVCMKQVIVPKSTVHKLDLLLRKRIKLLLTELDNSSCKQTKSLHLNEKRKEILSEFRLLPFDEIKEDDLNAFVDMLNI